MRATRKTFSVTVHSSDDCSTLLAKHSWPAPTASLALGLAVEAVHIIYMDRSTLPVITEQRRLASPAVAPQALAWHNNALWLGSRDLRRIYGINVESWTVFEESDAPGTPWAAVSTGLDLRFTIGEGADDDRYIRPYHPGIGFSVDGRIACPEFTGSYLSFDTQSIYLSQWYKHRILRLDQTGNTQRIIDVGAEICGHAFVAEWIYVIRGTEKDGESWRIARLDPRVETPDVRDLAVVPFPSRSLTFDGQNFWTNHRAANEVVCFNFPA